MKRLLLSGLRVSRQTVQGASRSSLLFLVSGLWFLISYSTQAVLDTNSNGMSDLWEKQFNNNQLFPNTAPFQLANDPDQDRWNNAMEAEAGTDPFDANAPGGFVVPDIVKELAPGAFTITWPSIPGKLYQLQCSETMQQGAWLDYGDALLGNGLPVIKLVENTTAFSNTPPKLFYRIAIYDIDQDGNGLSDHEEHMLVIAPGFTDANANALPDDWETAHAGTFAVYPPMLAARIFQNHESQQSIYLRNDTNTAVNYTIALTGNTRPGYSFRDSITGNIPYTWEEISSTGILLSTLSNADDASAQVSFTGGFTFPFYGQNFSQINVCSNGFLNFGAKNNSYGNTSLPHASAPSNLIAVFWDDLTTSTTGEIYYQQESDRLII